MFRWPSKWQVASGTEILIGWPLATCYLLLAGALLLSACAARPTLTPSALPPPSPTTPDQSEVLALLSPTAPLPPSPLAPTPAGPHTLTVCLPAEPTSLYPYTRPEPGRADIWATLYDGPIDNVNYRFQPVLIEKLPNLADGDAVVNMVVLNAGDTVVDELGRVVTLTAGVTVNLLNGEQSTYAGSGALTVPQLTATFKLKPGVQWSDGQPLTAHDSVFAYTVSGSPDSFNPRRVLTERTATYHALDDMTLEWVGLPGYIDPVYFTNFFTPLPHHRYAGLTPAQIADSDEARFRPLGWGPFRLKEWVPGQTLTVERNPFYFRASEGWPWAETVTFRFTAEAECDIHLIDENDHPALVHLDFNLAVTPLADSSARYAIAQCLDRAAFSADIPATYLPATHPIFVTDIVPMPFDPARGRAYFTSPLTLTLVYAPTAEATALTVAKQLRTNCALGIDLRPLTRGELLGDWPNGVVFGRHFDLALFTWHVGPTPPCDLWLTAQIANAANPGGSNNTGYSNPAFDTACRRALTTLDPALAAQYHVEAQRLWAQDLPVLPLFFTARTAAVRPEVQGFVLDPTSPSALWNIETLARQP